MKTVLVAYGTRPEAVKVGPLILELRSSAHINVVPVTTGQHREMLDQVNGVFGIEPVLDIAVLRQGQSLNALAARVLQGMDSALAQVEPDAILVQGDTTTVAMSALAAFHRHVPVVHLEAGLRSHDLQSPFPEEANRRLAGQLTRLHLAPTGQARANLLAEGFPGQDVVVTGNTVIDALLHTAQTEATFSDPEVADAVRSGRRIILMTAHRRENLGEPMRDIARAVAEIAQRYPDVQVVFPAHKNPRVRELIFPVLTPLPNVSLIEPLDYVQFIHLQQAAHLILTDSGGVQEEAPSLGKPVLVLRTNTERPEAVEAGTVRLVGTDVNKILSEVSRLLDDASAYEEMAHAVNPYGDGLASRRSVAAIEEMFGLGHREADFVPMVDQS
ncbi:UDP-N-acetylglucosamine 2-epimerase (non-hydrolyzing) [Janibacter sp. LM]|uniref:non-hydrolyzing UDP-N-acetylglucosamine 2-epimerase n=1 Tax=Janibacter sp. LM TaxID=3144845 RepID=UPI0031F7140F